MPPILANNIYNNKIQNDKQLLQIRTYIQILLEIFFIISVYLRTIFGYLGKKGKYDKDIVIIGRSRKGQLWFQQQMSLIWP